MPISREQAIEALGRHDREVDARLRAAQARVDELRAELTEAKAIRVAVIEEAIAGGWPQAQVGRSLGVTRQRVRQIRAEHGQAPDNPTEHEG